MAESESKAMHEQMVRELARLYKEWLRKQKQEEK